jgi:hypothetical protein
MRATDIPDEPIPHHGHETLEFARVVNLSDAVFAIAMTLLVFTLFEVPDVPADRLAAELAGQLPQLVAFVLSFGLVANIWWAHHRFFARLGAVEAGTVAINAVLLAAVALVPYPTNLIGRDPTARAAVVPYIALLLLLSLLMLGLVLRARAAGLWRWELPAGLFPWLLAGWAANIGVMAGALLVAVWVPVAGLALLPLTGAVETVMIRRAPAAYHRWR